jgi:hypothetical protein
MSANPESLFCDCELRTYVLILFRAENDLFRDALVAGIVKIIVRFQVLTAASMKFIFVFWDVLPCKIIVDVSEVRAASIIRAITSLEISVLSTSAIQSIKSF